MLKKIFLIKKIEKKFFNFFPRSSFDCTLFLSSKRLKSVFLHVFGISQIVNSCQNWFSVFFHKVKESDVSNPSF